MQRHGPVKMRHRLFAAVLQQRELAPVICGQLERHVRVNVLAALDVAEQGAAANPGDPVQRPTVAFRAVPDRHLRGQELRLEIRQERQPAGLIGRDLRIGMGLERLAQRVRLDPPMDGRADRCPTRLPPPRRFLQPLDRGLDRIGVGHDALDVLVVRAQDAHRVDHLRHDPVIGHGRFGDLLRGPVHERPLRYARVNDRRDGPHELARLGMLVRPTARGLSGMGGAGHHRTPAITAATTAASSMPGNARSTMRSAVA